MEWKYSEDKKRITIAPPKQLKRITGHRIAAILGLDPYMSEFQAWCEITKLYTEKIEDNKYLKAGRAIEPKLINYVAERFPNVMSIEEYYGNNFEDYRYNNFKDDSNVFGGVIDAVATASDKKTILMICECKTGGKPQNWANHQLPVTYLLQGALYSYLKGLDEILFAYAYLENNDYNHPEMYQCTEQNTLLVVKRLKDLLFEINGDWYNIEEIMQHATDWWNKYVVTGISPEFDKEKDKKVLDALRDMQPREDIGLDDMIAKLEKLEEENAKYEEDEDYKAIAQKIKKNEDSIKILKDNIKIVMIEHELEKVGRAKLTSKTSDKIDVDLLKTKYKDTYEKVVKPEVSYTLRFEKKKEEK